MQAAVLLTLSRKVLLRDSLLEEPGGFHRIRPVLFILNPSCSGRIQVLLNRL